MVQVVPTSGQMPLADRVADLTGATVALVGNGFWESDRVLAALRSYLEDTYMCTVVGPECFPSGNGPIASAESGIAELCRSLGVDAAVVGNAACGHCATSCAWAAARLELAGIPTALILRDGYEDRVEAAFELAGLPAVVSAGYIFADSCFAEGAGIAPFVRHFPDVLSALVTP